MRRFATQTGEKFDQMKQLAERAEQAKERAAGVLDELKRELSSVWQCKSVEAAKKKLAQMEEEVEDLEAEADEAFEQFQEQWDEWEAKLNEHKGAYDKL